MQQPECHTCKLLQNFIEDLQSRMKLLFIELQQRPCHPLPETSRDDELQSRITANEHLNGPNDSEGPSKSTGRGWKCQDPDCFDKPKTLFTKRNNFVRHYSQHVKCNESCRFCGLNITNVREYVTHFDKCKEKKRQEELGHTNPTIKNEAIEQRRLLIKRAGDQLNQQPSTASRVGDEEALSVASDAHHVEAGRKRRRTMDPVPDMATEQISSHTIPPTRGLHQDPNNYESGPSSRITEAPSKDSTALLPRAPFAGSYTIDEPFDATRAPFADSYTINEAFNATLSPQAPFAPSYTIDEPFDKTPHPQAPFDASYSPDGGLGSASQYPAYMARIIQQHRWTGSTRM
ncbi:hypothetical protein F5883DRAFT_67405 [Diaporthe sp. PMI_573]|nr:hypothetical protein F5883DRAFT_67405 [Diaporthaceae sp. PMI_573]